MKYSNKNKFYVTFVEWSSNGRFIATLDDFKFRAWDSQIFPDDSCLKTIDTNRKTIDGIPRMLYYPELMEPTYILKNKDSQSSLNSRLYL